MEQVSIGFPNASSADASRLADDLTVFVRRYVPGATAEATQESPDAMDLGATVAIILGTPAVLALARGIADWIRRQGDPDIIIKSKKGEIIVKGGLSAEQKHEIIMETIGKGIV